MFNETHSDESIVLTFLKSTNVQVYPCGRRRSELIDKDGNKEGTTDDQFYFPFDPEARLNTEANNRKHSGVNGYTQTYLGDWDNTNKLLTMSLAGYLFNISLDDDYLQEDTGDVGTIYRFKTNDFGEKIAYNVGNTDTEYIYANILIEDVHLFAGFQQYFTGILRNQSGTVGQYPAPSLDLLDSLSASQPARELLSLTKDFNNYYFSGLSFSVTPLTGEVATRSSKTITPIRDAATGKTVTQIQVSLRILEKEGDTWKIHQPALLPKIEHGDTDDSIVVTGNALLKSDLSVEDNIFVKDNINVGNLTDEEKAIANDGGCIVAKNNIIAGQNLIAPEANIYQTLNVQKATGTGDDAIANIDKAVITTANITTANTTTADIDTANIAIADIATATIDTADIGTADIDTANITTANTTTANTTTANIATANITTADIATTDIETANITTANLESTTITGKLEVQNESPDNAILRNAMIPGMLIVKNPAYAAAPADPDTRPAELTADMAGIDALSAGTIEAEVATITDTLRASDIKQKIGEGDVYYNVPVIFVQPQKSTSSGNVSYQLQISRPNFLTEQAVD
jgi:hypothetical protein